MKAVAVAVVVVLAMVQFIAEPAHAITCGQVDAALAPCVPYLTQGGLFYEFKLCALTIYIYIYSLLLRNF